MQLSFQTPMARLSIILHQFPLYNVAMTNPINASYENANTWFILGGGGNATGQWIQLHEDNHNQVFAQVDTIICNIQHLVRQRQQNHGYRGLANPELQTCPHHIYFNQDYRHTPHLYRLWLMPCVISLIFPMALHTSFVQTHDQSQGCNKWHTKHSVNAKKQKDQSVCQDRVGHFWLGEWYQDDLVSPDIQSLPL